VSNLNISGLEFAYPGGEFTLAIPQLSFPSEVRAAIIGPSGCGKTTLLYLLAGILRPRRGRIEIGGTDIAALDEAARRSFRIRRIGLVFQDFELLEYLDVLDNILLPFRINASLSLDRAARDRGRDLAERVGLGAKLKRPIARLSHGERQRVALCRALAAEPSLILADEPTGSLDPESKERAVALLAEFCAGATLIVATHDHALLPQFEQVVDFRELMR
jgi:putative ABC transport system ATP-binding protein